MKCTIFDSFDNKTLHFRTSTLVISTFIFWFTLMLPLADIAQDQTKSKIKFKDGTIIKGNVFDSFEGTSVKIRLDTGQPIFINFEKIRKITYRDGSGNNRSLTMKNGNLVSQKIGLKDHSLYHELKGGILFGEDNTSVTIHNINGYQFKRFIAPGLGFGFDRFGSYRTVPVYAHLKGYIMDRKVAPYYFADAGYGFAWYNTTNEEAYKVTDVHGGFYWQVGLGYRISYPHSAMLLTLGYKNQNAGLKYVFNQQPWLDFRSNSDVEVSEKRILRRVAFTIGFLF